METRDIRGWRTGKYERKEDRETRRKEQDRKIAGAKNIRRKTRRKKSNITV